MKLLAWLLLCSGGYPLGRAWLANRQTTLFQAIHWAGVAWAAWLVALALPILHPGADTLTARYVALGLTGAAGVAVLGARRPGVAAWNFVVVGLVAVLIMPVAQGLGRPRLETLNLLFLGATVAVGVLNYLPTRMGGAAFVLACGCAWHLAGLGTPEPEPHPLDVQGSLGDLLLGVSPWVALAQMQGRWVASEFDRLWLDFRDRFGFVWGQRLREQFNRAAANAGFPVYLRWSGLRLRPGTRLPEVEVQEEIVRTLRAMLRRFGPETEERAGSSGNGGDTPPEDTPAGQ
jgi:hypothetical protein